MFEFVSTIYSTLKSNTPRILKKEKDFKHKEHFHHKFNTEHLERPSQHHTAMLYVSTSYF